MPRPFKKKTPACFCLVFFLYVQLPLSCRAQATDSLQVADTVAERWPGRAAGDRPRLSSLIMPGALFAYGALTYKVDFLREQNQSLKKIIWEDNPHRPLRIDDYTMFVPVVAVYTLNIAGVHGRNNLRDRSMILGLSSVLANGISFGVKRSGIELRPDGSDRASFPSGHTTQAFVSAEFFYQEYKGRVHWTAIAGSYAVAAGTGFLRMYNNKHWFSDVVAGAGIGIAATRFVYYVYPEIRQLLFGNCKTAKNLVILPTYQNGMIGCAGVFRF